MNRGLSRALALSILTVTFASTPALADMSSGRDGGAEHAGDRGGDRGHEGGGGHDEGGGGSRGTPAPIAGLGLLAFGAIGYGLRKLRK